MTLQRPNQEWFIVWRMATLKASADFFISMLDCISLTAGQLLISARAMERLGNHVVVFPEMHSRKHSKYMLGLS